MIIAKNGKIVTDEMIAGWEEYLECDVWPPNWENVGGIIGGDSLESVEKARNELVKGKTMDVNEYMRLRGLTDSDVDKMAEPYEEGAWEAEHGKVFRGSHINKVEKESKQKRDISNGEYKLANGYILTDEEIEERAKYWEDETEESCLVTICIPEDLAARYYRLAEMMGKPKTYYMVKALEEAIDGLEREYGTAD